MEILVSFKPEWFVYSNNLIKYLNDSTEFRAKLALRSDKVQLMKERFKFDGLYYHYKPDIEFESKDDLSGDKITIYIDEIGFRNKRNTYSRHKIIPYVFLGDSGTFGVDSKKGYPEIFGNLINDVTLNLSMGGHGPQQYLESLKRFGINKKPKIIFIAMYINDIRDAQVYNSLKRQGINDCLRYLTASVTIGDKKFKRLFFLKHSNLIHFLYGAFAYPPWSIDRDKKANRSTTTDFSIVLDNGLKTYRFNNIEPPPLTLIGREEWIGPAVSALEQIVDIAKSIRSRVVLTYIPKPSEVYYPYIKKGKDVFYKKYNPESDDFGWAMGLNEIAKRLKIEFIDPRDKLRCEASVSPLIYGGINDAHFNSRGHEIFARILYNCVHMSLHKNNF